MIITDKAQIKIAELRESNNLRLSESDELECYELIESDLKLPADVTFTRSSVAYLSDGTQVDANMPRFEQGRFGKAILIEEGTTNLLRYSEQFDTSNWLKDGVTVTSNATIAPNGTLTADKITQTKLNGRISQHYTIDPVNKTFTFSVWLKSDVPQEVTIKIQNNDNTEWTDLAANVTTEWQRFSVTKSFTLTDKTAVTVLIWAIRYGSSSLGSVYVWGAQLEQKSYATSYVATTSSTATRSFETLTIPTAGVLNPQEGTVEMRLYVNPAHRDPSSVRRFFGHLPGSGNSNRITMQHNNAPYWLFTIGDANGNTHGLTINDSDVADGWRLFTMKWGVSEFAVYVDGIKKAFLLNPTCLPSAVGQKITIDGSTNALIDDLRISSIARSDEEILAAYQSGQPLAADEWTTYKLDFDDKVRITTQGQIICNELIEI